MSGYHNDAIVFLIIPFVMFGIPILVVFGLLCYFFRDKGKK